MAPASSSDRKTTLCFSNEGLRERLEPKYQDPLAIENNMAKHKPFAIIARAYMAKGHGQTGGVQLRSPCVSGSSKRLVRTLSRGLRHADPTMFDARPEESPHVRAS